jgi:hypothetical protein
LTESSIFTVPLLPGAAASTDYVEGASSAADKITRTTSHDRRRARRVRAPER